MMLEKPVGNALGCGSNPFKRVSPRFILSLACDGYKLFTLVRSFGLVVNDVCYGFSSLFLGLRTEPDIKERPVVV
jgi:hypothetical protein